MAFNLGSMLVKIGADISGLEKGLDKAQRVTQRVADKMTAIGSRLTIALSVPLLGIGAAAIKMSADMEQARIAFKTLVGGAEKSKKFLKDLFDFALNTPFTFVGLQESAKKLLAMGFQAKQIIPTMEAVGNAVAALGGGQPVIDRVTLAIGQMRAKGKVSAEEMKQLAEAGIPAWEFLAKTLNTTVAGAMDKVQKRTVESGTAIAGMLNQMNTRFKGMMSQQVKTITGQFSVMRDQLNKILAEIGDDIIKTFDLKDKLSGFTKGLDNLSNSFAGLSANMKTFILSATAAVAIVGPLITGLGLVVSVMSAFAGALGLALAPIALITAGITALVASGIALFLNWDKVAGFAVKAWAQIKLTILENIQGILEGMDGFVNFLPGIGKAFTKSLGFIIQATNEARSKLRLIEFNEKDINKELDKVKTAVEGFKIKGASIDDVFGTGGASSEKFKAVSEIIKQLEKDISIATAESNLFGKSFDLVSEKTNILESAIKALLTAGVDQSNSKLQILVGWLNSVRTASTELAVAIDPVGQALNRMALGLQTAIDKSQLFGEGFDLNQAKVGILETAITSLLENGIRPGNNQLQLLVEQLDKVNQAIDETKNKTIGFEGAFKKGFQNMGAAAVTFGKNMAVTFLTGARNWQGVLQGFINAAIGAIVDAAFAAMGIAKLVSTAMSQMFNPAGFLIIGGLLIALSAISSGLASKTASAATGSSSTNSTQGNTIIQPSQSTAQNVIFVNGNLVDLAQLSRELEPFNVELIKDTV